MASANGTAAFFTHGTCAQYEQVLKLYPQALRLKADQKAKKPEELIKLDNWYQNELPKKIKSRGKDAHMIHEELVQCMKWKQIRGKYYPQLSYLIKVNTPRAVMQETKKAFKKLPNLEQALTALSNLKGVGTTMASALLAAACPESAPFMADECLMAIPDIEGIDYTAREYLNFVKHIRSKSDKLNKLADENKGPDAFVWTPHKVELAIWTHSVISDMKPELLSSIKCENGNSINHQNGDSLDTLVSDESNQEPLNGKTNSTVIDEDTTTSFTDNSPPSIESEETNESVVSDSTNDSAALESNKRPLEIEEDSNSANQEQPTIKKLKDGSDK